MVEALLAAKVESLQQQGIKALPLLAPFCSVGTLPNLDGDAVFHKASLHTRHDLNKVSGLQVDVDNMQEIDGSHSRLRLVPVILHPGQGSTQLVLVFVYQCYEEISSGNWCLASADGHPVTFLSPLHTAAAVSPFDAVRVEASQLAAHLQMFAKARTEGPVGDLTAQQGSLKTRRRRARAQRCAAARKLTVEEERTAAEAALEAPEDPVEDDCVVSGALSARLAASLTAPPALTSYCQAKVHRDHKSEPWNHVAWPRTLDPWSMPVDLNDPNGYLALAPESTLMRNETATPGTVATSDVMEHCALLASAMQLGSEASTTQPFAVGACAGAAGAGAACRAKAKRGDHLKIRSVTEETPVSFGDGSLRFVIHELLGQGGFGSVYRCLLTDAQEASSEEAGALAVALAVGQQFAVKVINAQRIALLVGSSVDDVVPRLLREAQVLHMLGKHPHIVTLHEAFISEGSHNIYFVYELIKGGDLFAAVVRRRQPFNEPQSRRILLQLAEAVLYGHKRGIAHRDLKMDNCLVEDVGTLSVKVCDYGQAIIMGSHDAATTLTSSSAYTAPDVKRAVGTAKSYDAFKADVFALGVLLYGLLCNALPNAAMGMAYKSHPVWKSLSTGAQDLLQKMLAPESASRPTVDEILCHPWIAQTPPFGPPRPPAPLQAPGAIEEHCRGEAQLKVFLATHQVVVALQRERGQCLASGASEGWQWHVKFTDERYTEAFRQLEAMETQAGAHHEAVWRRLGAVLTYARTKTEASRAHAIELLSRNTASLVEPSVIDPVVHRYGIVLSVIMRVVAICLAEVHRDEGLSKMATKHKLLMLTAEQLGCERALLCGYLHQPSRLRDPEVAGRISQVIGARKLLLGSSLNLEAYPLQSCDDDTLEAEPQEASWAAHGCIVAGIVGLFPVLDLIDAPLLDPTELQQLENAEDRALSANNGSVPQLSEWYMLLTGLIDKIHQHIVLNILDHFELNIGLLPRVRSS